jgi:uncharacterized protein YegL
MRLFGLMVFLALSLVTGARAATTPAGADLVFLVDQSGSMMGKGDTRVANDPYGKRIAAIKQLDAQLLQSAMAGFVNRISVVEFGGRHARHRVSQPQITLSRKEIPAVAPGQDPATIRAFIKAALTPIAPTFRGDTDIADAMRLAQDELDHYQRNPPPLGPGTKAGDRIPIVVLITDGAPSAERVPEPQMKREIEAWTGRLSVQSNPTKFLVFGLNDASRYWENYWGKFWRGVTARDTQSPEGLAFLIDRNEDATKRIGEVLAELIPPGANTGGDDTYTAPAYLKSLTFTIDYNTPYLPPGTVGITDPTGKTLPLTEEHGIYATIILPHPLPGQYRLRSARSPYRVQVLPVYESSRLVAPAVSVKQYGEETIRYRLDGRGPNGRFMPQANLPAVHFAAEMVLPDGKRQVIPMAIDPGTGEVVSQAPFRFEQPGRYQLTLSGTTKAQDGTESIVYKGDDRLQVDSATPVQAYFAAPDPNTAIQLWQGAASVPVQLRFRNAHTGADLTAAQVLGNGAALHLGFQEDQTRGRDRFDSAPSSVVLQPDGTGLAATLPVAFGHTRWDLLFNPSKIRLRIDLPSADPWRQGINYHGIAGTNDFRLGPELTIRESLWALWVVAAVLLAVLIAGALFWRFFMIRWLIERSDRKYKRAPRLNYTVPSAPDRCAKDWALRGVHIVAEPRVVTLGDGSPWSIEQFQIKRLRRPGQRVAIQVSYRPFGVKKGKPIKRVLEATNDSMAANARHNIVGLLGENSADFVLFCGKSDSL